MDKNETLYLNNFEEKSRIYDRECNKSEENQMHHNLYPRCDTFMLRESSGIHKMLNGSDSILRKSILLFVTNNKSQ